MDIEQIAKIAYEITRVYGLAIGEYLPESWEYVQEKQRAKTLKGVIFHLENPGESQKRNVKDHLFSAVVEQLKNIECCIYEKGANTMGYSKEEVENAEKIAEGDVCTPWLLLSDAQKNKYLKLARSNIANGGKRDRVVRVPKVKKKSRKPGMRAGDGSGASTAPEQTLKQLNTPMEALQYLNTVVSDSKVGDQAVEGSSTAPSLSDKTITTAKNA